MVMPEEQRRFAVEVVRRLRGAGFEAYWAGGCVRDQLLGRTPKDYDVATNATPEQVRDAVRPPPHAGHRRRLRRDCGDRAEGGGHGRSDHLPPRRRLQRRPPSRQRHLQLGRGRRLPPRLHHQRPVLRSGRAAGDRLRRRAGGPGRAAAPRHRLRPRSVCRGQAADAAGGAVRGRLRFHARRRGPRGHRRDGRAKSTSSAPSGSPWRCGGCWPMPAARPGVRLLLETGLAAEVLPEIVPRDESDGSGSTRRWSSLGAVGRASAAFRWRWPPCCLPFVDAAGAAGRVPALATVEQGDRARRLAGANIMRRCDAAATMRWSELQPLLVAEGIGDLLALVEAAIAGGLPRRRPIAGGSCRSRARRSIRRRC